MVQRLSLRVASRRHQPNPRIGARRGLSAELLQRIPMSKTPRPSLHARGGFSQPSIIDVSLPKTTRNLLTPLRTRDAAPCAVGELGRGSGLTDRSRPDSLRPRLSSRRRGRKRRREIDIAAHGGVPRNVVAQVLSPRHIPPGFPPDRVLDDVRPPRRPRMIRRPRPRVTSPGGVLQDFAYPTPAVWNAAIEAMEELDLPVIRRSHQGSASQVEGGARRPQHCGDSPNAAADHPTELPGRVVRRRADVSCGGPAHCHKTGCPAAGAGTRKAPESAIPESVHLPHRGPRRRDAARSDRSSLPNSSRLLI